MADELYSELMKMLTPLMMCSVSDRYSVLHKTRKGKLIIDIINFEGGAVYVADRIDRALRNLGGVSTVRDFIEEIKDLPKPEWYG
jgi:hypothetical protein